jgi:hypothetical protein
MANNKRRKEVWRRDKETQAILDALDEDGRENIARFFTGSVRTIVCLSTNEPTAPVLIDQHRYYWAGGKTGVTRFLEASDLVHGLAGLSRAESFIKGTMKSLDRPRTLPEWAVLQAVDRGNSPPRLKFVHGNVAANWFTEDVYDGSDDGSDEVIDYVTKVELLSVNRPGVARPLIWSGQVQDARECILDVLAAMEELHGPLEFAGAAARK